MRGYSLLGKSQAEAPVSSAAPLVDSQLEQAQLHKATLIQRRWRSRTNLLKMFAPYFYMQRSGQPAAFGAITFEGGHSRSVRPARAEWIRLASEEFDNKPKRILLLMERFWHLKTPNLIISVTGVAQNIQLDPQLAKRFGQGLSNVLKATDAWVITGGTQYGVMDLVGVALDQYAVKSPLIGICPWNIVRDRHKLLAAHDEGAPSTSYRPGAAYSSEQGATGAASSASAQTEFVSLQPNHDYFLFIDQPQSDSHPDSFKFGADIRPRAKLELAAVRHRSVPTVLLVVSGGKGTFDQVLEAVREGCPVVLVARSGQVADALHGVSLQLRAALAAQRQRAGGDALGAGGGSEGEGARSGTSAAASAADVEAAVRAAGRSVAFAQWAAGFSIEVQEEVYRSLKDMLTKLALQPHLLRSFDFSAGAGGGDLNGEGSWQAGLEGSLDVVLLEAILSDERPAKYSDARNRSKLEVLLSKASARGDSASASQLQRKLGEAVRTEASGVESVRGTMGNHLRLACEWRRTDIAMKITSRISAWANESTQRSAGRELRMRQAQVMVRDCAQRVLVFIHEPLIAHLLSGEEVPRIKMYHLDLISLFGESVQQRFGLFRRERHLGRAILQLKAAKFAFVPDLEKPDDELVAFYAKYCEAYVAVVRPFYEQYSPMVAGFVGRATRVTAAHWFLWAVLLASQPMVELFLDRSKQPLRLCIVGAHLCAVLAEQPDVEPDAYATIRERLETTALEIIDRAAEAGRDVAYRMLVRGSPKWGGLSPLELALDMDVQSFLAHRTVQLVVGSEWWRGKFPHSPLAVHAGTPGYLVLLEAWVPFFRFAQTMTLSTDAIGLPHAKAEVWDSGAEPLIGRLANVGQMRLAVKAVALHDRWAQAMHAPVEARLASARSLGGASAGAGAAKPAPSSRGEGGSKQATPVRGEMRSRMHRAGTIATFEAPEDKRKLAQQSVSTLLHGRFCHPVLHRLQFMHLLHVPLVKFSTRFVVYLVYLGMFLWVVAKPAAYQSMGETDAEDLRGGTSTHTMRLLLNWRDEFPRLLALRPGDPGYHELDRIDIWFACFSACMTLDEAWQLIMELTVSRETGRPVVITPVNWADWLIGPTIVVSTTARWFFPGTAHIHSFVLSLLVYISTIRLLEFTSIYKPVGVLMTTFVKMIVDVGIWLLMLITFVVAASFLYHGLFADEYSGFASHSILYGLFSNSNPTVWSMFGEYMSENICSRVTDDAQGADVLGSPELMGACIAETVVVWGNVLIMQIILVNLLIAMMSETYSDSKLRADEESKSNQVKRTVEYILYYFPLPPPFNAPILVVLIPIWAVQFIRQSYSHSRSASLDPEGNAVRERTVAWYFLAQLATPHASRDDVLFLSDIRKSQPVLPRQVGEAPGLLFERIPESQRHLHLLNGLEALRVDLESVARGVNRLSRQQQGSANGSAQVAR